MCAAIAHLYTYVYKNKRSVLHFIQLYKRGVQLHTEGTLFDGFGGEPMFAALKRTQRPGQQGAH